MNDFPDEPISYVIEAWHINTHLGYVVLHDSGTRGVTTDIAHATSFTKNEAWITHHWLNHYGEPKVRYNITRDMVAYAGED